MFNSALVGFIPVVDNEGVKHTVEARLGIDLESFEYTLTIAMDGELVSGLEMTESSGVYTIALGS